MMNDSPDKSLDRTGIGPIARAIYGPLKDAYRSGGFALAYLFLGALFLVTSLLVSGAPSPARIAVGGLGAVLVLATLFAFAYGDLLPMRHKVASLKQGEDLVVALETAAASLTDLAIHIQSVLQMYGPELIQALATLDSVLDPQTMALLPEEFRQIDLRRASIQILAVGDQVRLAITDLKGALADGDAEGIHRYTEKVHEADARIRAHLDTIGAS